MTKKKIIITENVSLYVSLTNICHKVQYGYEKLLPNRVNNVL